MRLKCWNVITIQLIIKDTSKDFSSQCLLSAHILEKGISEEKMM